MPAVVAEALRQRPEEGTDAVRVAAGGGGVFAGAVGSVNAGHEVFSVGRAEFAVFGIEGEGEGVDGGLRGEGADTWGGWQVRGGSGVRGGAAAKGYGRVHFGEGPDCEGRI